MERLSVFIHRSKTSPVYSLLSIYNNVLQESMYSSMVRNAEILPIMSDLKIPTKDSLINITKGHALFVQLKNLEYKVIEHDA